MRIAAIQKTTLLDYPGRVACTVFLPGCNLRCPFCHNGGLVLPEQLEESSITEKYLMNFLDRRKGKLDGVCITGGEPTIHHDLPELIHKIRAKGFLVKLDTNGSNPRMLQALMEEKLLSYVAMDIKNSPRRYKVTCGGVDVLAQVQESVRLLKEGKIPYEFRTTVSHPYHDQEAMEEIGRWLQGADAYFLQAFQDSGNLVGQGSTPLTEQEIRVLQSTACKYIPCTRIRGI